MPTIVLSRFGLKSLPLVGALIRITSYNVCYTKLLRFEANQIVASPDLKGKLVRRPLGIHSLEPCEADSHCTPSAKLR